jgi:hypothetical protein
MDGVIDTVQWEGYREGIDDLRYLATLRNAIVKAHEAGGDSARLADERTAVHRRRWTSTGDLYELRNTMIDWILRLRE